MCYNISMLDLSALNKEQLLPVMDTEGAVLVTAGAGSGKTRLLTYRIANLIINGKVPAYNILAITFTNKAAREMKERLLRMLPEGEDIFISTFHSMCVTILRRFIENLSGGGAYLSGFYGGARGANDTATGENGENTSYNRNFTIYDEAERKKVLKLVAKQVDKDNDGLAEAADVALSRVKNAGKDIGSYADDYKFLPDADDIVECMYKYQNEMLARNAMDFDDLLYVTYDLLAQSKQAREYYQQRFRYIHVDEFQDTNVIQYKLVKLLAGGYGNIFVVGDEDQSIYGWRGANIGNIRDFIRDFDCRIYKLEQNYRSSNSILSLANAVIKNNTTRIDKKLWTENGEGARPQLFIAGSEGEEADFVMQSVKGLYASGQEYKSMAVLMRINALSRAIEQKFMFYGIPYRLYGGFKFYDRREIKDVLAYLKLLDNHRDGEAAMRVLAFPKKGIGETSVGKIVGLARELGVSIYEVVMACLECTVHSAQCTVKVGDKELGVNVEDNEESVGRGLAPAVGRGALDAPPNEKIKAKSALVKQELGGALTAKLSLLAKQLNLMEENKDAKVSIQLKFLYNMLNLGEVFGDGTEDDENRRFNVRELISSVVETERQNPDMTLSDYLQQIMLYSDLDGEPEGDCVSIFTVHSAKGLEFDTVFIVGAEDGLFPLSRAMDSVGELEEERRLMYVALTRAKKRLFVSHTRARFMYGQSKPSMPSRFLYESGLLKARERTGFFASVPPFAPASSRFSSSSASSSSSFSVSSSSSQGSPLNKLPPTGVDIGRLAAGTKIKHKRLGAGVIKSVDPKSKQVDVEFDSIGLITLSVEFAPITILEQVQTWVKKEDESDKDFKTGNDNCDKNGATSDLIASLTKGAAQRKWFTPTEFPCCPTETNDGKAITEYVKKLKEGAIFAKNKYGESTVLRFAVHDDKKSILVLTLGDDENKPWALAEVTYENKLYIHTSLGRFFTPDGAEKQFTLAQGKKWTGEDSIDDYC